MGCIFASVEEAKRFVAGAVQENPDSFREIPGLRFEAFAQTVLENPGVSESYKNKVRDKLAAQQGFGIKTKGGGEIQIVVEPSGSGYHCWILGKKRCTPSST